MTEERSFYIVPETTNANPEPISIRLMRDSFERHREQQAADNLAPLLERSIAERVADEQLQQRRDMQRLVTLVYDLQAKVRLLEQALSFFISVGDGNVTETGEAVSEVKGGDAAQTGS